MTIPQLVFLYRNDFLYINYYILNFFFFVDAFCGRELGTLDSPINVIDGVSVMVGIFLMIQ